MAESLFAGFGDTPFLQEARDRYKFADESETNQSSREKADIAFENGEQWPADIKLQRMGQQPNNGMPAIPSRPTLVFDKVKEPIAQILNQERAADLSIELTPADDFGDLGILPDDTEIMVREGLIRRLQRSPEAQDARSWAFKRAVIAGRGYYQVVLRYVSGKTFAQEITIERIYNQSSVKLDPSHQQPDGSDADWGFVGAWMSWSKFKSQYPKDVDGKRSALLNADDSLFRSMAENYPEWYTDDPKSEKAIWIADYWYATYEPRTLLLLKDGRVVFGDEVKVDEADVADRRTMPQRVIKYSKIAGGIVELERTDWIGPDIPIVKVVGEEVLPYDEERRYNGVVRPARDSQQALNYMASKYVEMVGLSPVNATNLDPEAISGYESFWEQANVRPAGYLPSRTYDDQGRPFSRPAPIAADPHLLPAAQGIQIFDGMIRSTTRVPDPTLGNVDPSLKSGRAIREVVANAQQSTSNYLDSLVRSMRYEAKIINNLLYPVYGNGDRLVRIMTGEGEGQLVQLSDSGASTQDARMGHVAQAKTVAKLTKDAQFNIVIKIAKSTENRRQQFVDMYGQILSADPTQMAVGGDLFYRNLDIPESKQLAKRQRLMLHPNIQQMLAAEEQGITIDPAVQAELAKMAQQLEQAQGIIQELSLKASEQQTKVQIEQMSAQRDLQLESLKAEADLKKAQMDNAAKIRIAEINAETKGVITGHQLDHEATAQGREMGHEAAMQAMSQQHDAELARQQSIHAVEMAAAGVGPGTDDSNEARPE